VIDFDVNADHVGQQVDAIGAFVTDPFQSLSGSPISFRDAPNTALPLLSRCVLPL
jgi:hypothetical protein